MYKCLLAVLIAAQTKNSLVSILSDEGVFVFYGLKNRCLRGTVLSILNF